MIDEIITGHKTSRSIFWLILSIYLIISISLVILFLLGEMIPSKIPSDWWSALGVLATLTFFIVVTTYFREKEFIETNKSLKNNYNKVLSELKSVQQRLENNKELASISTIVLDITTDNYTNREKWEENYELIKELYNSNIITKHNLFRMSMEAWKQKAIAFAFRLRILALYQYPEDKYWKTKILEILPYVDYEDLIRYDQESKLKQFESFDSFIKYFGLECKSLTNCITQIESIKLSTDNPLFALYGRLEYKRENFKSASILFEKYLCVTKLNTMWPYRFLLCLNVRYNKKIRFEENLDKLQNIYNSRIEPDYSEELFIQFMNVIRDIWNEKKEVTTFSKSLLIKAFNVTPINKFTMWHFYTDINNSEIDQNKKVLMTENYGIFYSFLGEEDKDADKKFNRNEIMELALK